MSLLYWKKHHHPVLALFKCTLFLKGPFLPSYPTIFVGTEKKEQKELAKFCLKCKVLNINIWFTKLLHKSGITLAIVQLVWTSAWIYLVKRARPSCKCILLSTKPAQEVYWMNKIINQSSQECQDIFRHHYVSTKFSLASHKLKSSSPAGSGNDTQGQRGWQ